MLGVDEQILEGQFKAIEGFHPDSHQALLNWGSWSRDQSGIRPTLDGSSLWESVQPERRTVPGRTFSQYEATRHLPAGTTVLADPTEHDDYNGRLGEEVDQIIHTTAYLPTWRSLVRAVYFYKLLPRQLPRQLSKDLKTTIAWPTLSQHYDAALGALSTALLFRTAA